MDQSIIYKKYQALSDLLMAEMNQEGFWTGRLSTSALSTAVSIVALRTYNDPDDKKRIETGFDWLLENINADGGFGDTPESVSNVSTTLLAYSAIICCRDNKNAGAVLEKMEKWLEGKGITSDPESITGSVLKFYGNDYTFSVPILSMLNLAGIIPSVKGIPDLPFRLTLLPQSLYRFFNLHVVSYAMPALIGVGIYLHTRRRKQMIPVRSVRNIFIRPAIRKLNNLIPDSGGFLEAVPLTAFVAMCLAASGEADNTTVQKGIEFLRKLQREDGGWPIDTDLSTWVTTLSVKALGNDLTKKMKESSINKLRDHLLDIQYKGIHPFNGAKPGGWGWTSFSGSVPDADDTPGAILALLELYSGTGKENEAILNGCRWLIDLQNTDGGFPTFCRGWGKLPFDRSCADLTGHSLLALLKTKDKFKEAIGKDFGAEIERSILKAVRYLEKKQADDGSWVPLWFGNQMTDDQTNPVYGTAKICTYLTDCLNLNNTNIDISLRLAKMTEKAQGYLISQQNIDGSWGGKKGTAGTTEETSLAICALAKKNRDACLKAVSWLEKQNGMMSSPIGLYFALLWYDEKMYPLIFQTEAFRRLLTD